MLNIAIFEDNKSEQQVLEQYSKNFFIENKISYTIDCFDTFPDQIYFLIKYDIIFLDIELENKNGIELGYKIRKKYPDLIIIIISKHPQYLIDGYRIDAKRYLLKPIDETIFKIELENVLRSSAFKQHFGFYDEKIAPFKIHYCEILFVESIGRKTFVHMTNNETVECIFPLKDWLRLLDDKGFARIQKSFIVNLEYIIKIENNNTVILSDENDLPLSRHYKESFYEKYYEHLRTVI